MLCPLNCCFMKISKLFHYLYGFLMLMPVFAVAVKCGYVMLNENAHDSYKGSYNYDSTILLKDYLSANPVTLESYTLGSSTYYYDDSNFYLKHFYTYGFVPSNYNYWIFLNVDNLIINDVSYPQVKSIYLFNQYSTPNYLLRVSGYDVTYDFDCFVDNSYRIHKNGNAIHSLNSLTEFNITNKRVSFDVVDSRVFVNASNNTALYPFNGFLYDSYIIDTTLSSVFYSAIQELDKTTFFGWARNSFIAEPFLYIGNLFGIPDVHPIFTFLSYWCAISIIYLVFDLFMYVPLLAHRWIDKGMIE